MLLSTPPLARKSGRLPRLWFFTDSRLAGAEVRIIQRLPPGTGVVLRNYDHPDRGNWARALVQLCRQRRLVVLVAGDDRLAFACRADGVHWPEGLARRPHRRTFTSMLVTVAAHGAAGLKAAARHRADAVFLSPVFVTVSHPDAVPLGIVRFGLLRRQTRTAVIALGGITDKTARRLSATGPAGFAAIESWKSEI
jgi:thiamine-phosphate pyrophosphorylase